MLGFDDRWTDVAELGRLAVIFEQDMSNLGPVQRGLHASVKPGVTLGTYQESRIRHYHRTLDSYLDRSARPLDGGRRPRIPQRIPGG